MSKNIKNLNCCDYGHETVEKVRRLPTGGNTAVIVCKHHFNNEMDFRAERNLTLESSAKFDIMKFEDLEIYNTGE